MGVWVMRGSNNVAVVGMMVVVGVGAGLALATERVTVPHGSASPEAVGQSLPRTPANQKPDEKKPAPAPAKPAPAPTTPAPTKPAPTKPAPTKPAESKPGEKPKTSGVLGIGVAAPRFEPDAWIKGQPISGFEKGKVYVVEFWATWCGPCRAAIPHLTKVQKDNKDLIVIGMASFERKPASGADDRRAKLEKFVRDQGDKMGYRVAFETNRRVGEAWMDAARLNGIPAAFIVGGDGKIAYIGPPGGGGFDSAVKTALDAAKKGT